MRALGGFRRSGRDWLAEYNRLLADRGESVEIGCVRVNRQTGERRRVTYLHTEFDGVSALRDGMVREGYLPEELPTLPARKRLPTRRLIGEIFRFLMEEIFPGPRLTWRFPNPRAPYRSYGPGEVVFDTAETARFLARAKRLGTAPSVLLLESFIRLARETWLRDASVTRWHITVNLRGRGNSGDEKGNCFSNFVQTVRTEESIAEIGRDQLARLKAGAHQATWFFLNIGDWRMFGGMLAGKVAKAYAKPRASPRITGTVSYLGAWPAKGVPDRVPDEDPVPFGNVSLENPLCMLAYIWHGRLIVGVTAHSSVCPSEDDLRNACAKWAGALRAETRA